MSKAEPQKIFAYGSLMWRPDFEFVQARPARLYGYHRRLCILSNHYRGTTEKPGLVLGLDRGGSCVGLVYDIAAIQWRDVIAKVRAREMIGDVYTEVVKDFVDLKSGEKTRAITYVVRHDSAQFMPKASIAQTLKYIQQGQGSAGYCTDYVANTIRHLRQMGIHDKGLEVFAPHVMGGDQAATDK